MIDRRAESEDGFLKDQDYLANYPYGYWPTSYNGCGWVAAFNLIHSIRGDVLPGDVYKGMLKHLTYNGRHGTPFPDLCAFFRDETKVPLLRIYGGAGILERLAESGCMHRGVMRYVEGNTPHYIAFYEVAPESVREESVVPDPLTPDGGPYYRFFNAADGLEDFVANMKNFRRDHISHDLLIRLLIVRDEKSSAVAVRLPIRGNGPLVESEKKAG